MWQTLAVPLSAGVVVAQATGVKTLICNIAKCFILNTFVLTKKPV